MRGMRFGGNARFDRDWTQGSIVRNLFSLSWPMIVTTTLMMIGPTIDMIWVGRLGSAAIAGVGVAGIAVMVVDSLKMGLITGLRALVSRFIGADDIEAANYVARQAFVISGVFALVLALVGIFLTVPILRLTGVSGDVLAEGSTYMRVMFIGTAAMAFRMMADGIMQASGDAVTPMKIAILYRLFHVGLSPFLIFGWWIFPKLGVTGAALTGVFSQALGAALGFWILFTGRSRMRLTLRDFRVDPAVIWRIVRIGIPSSVMGIQGSLSQFILLYFIVPFGTVAVAAHTVNSRIEMFLFLPTWGLGMAAGVLAAQNLGANRPERAEKTGWLAAAIVEGFTLLCAILLLLWAEKVTSVFTTDPSVVATTSTFLRIATAGYVLMGAVAVFQQCISGVGDTIPPMVFSLLISWAVQIPLAFFLPKITETGVYGIRWGMAAGMVVGAIAYTIYYKTGRWKLKKV